MLLEESDDDIAAVFVSKPDDPASHICTSVSEMCTASQAERVAIRRSPFAHFPPDYFDSSDDEL